MGTNSGELEPEGAIMGLLSWLLVGLVAGALAKLLMPGNQGGGCITTTILGIIGAVVGGWVFSFFGGGSVTGFNLGSLLVAVVGALVVLFVWGLLTGRK